MICERTLKRFCCEDISLIENYEQAINDDIQMWDCHHRFETNKGLSSKQLKEMGLYFNRPANELIFLTKTEHRRLHYKGKTLSAETRAKISAAGKGKKHSAETRAKISASRKGKKHSAETRAKISAIKKGKPSPLKGKPSPLKGRKRPHFSKEWCENISKGKKGKKLSPEL